MGVFYCRRSTVTVILYMHVLKLKCLMLQFAGGMNWEKRCLKVSET